MSFRVGVSAGLYRGRLAAPCVQARRSFLSGAFEKLKLRPSPPGGVKGGVNEAAPVPEANYLEGSYHWQYERISAVSLIPLTMVPLYGAVSGENVDYPLIDAVLCSVLLTHVQFGLASCIIDYIPKRKFGVWHKLAMYALYAGSAVSLYGVYELETKNNGLIKLLEKALGEEESAVYIFRR